MRIYMYMICVYSVQEERDVLTSIYESDESFKQLTPASFSYKVRTSASVQ